MAGAHSILAVPIPIYDAAIYVLRGGSSHVSPGEAGIIRALLAQFEKDINEESPLGEVLSMAFKPGSLGEDLAGRLLKGWFYAIIPTLRRFAEGEAPRHSALRHACFLYVWRWRRAARAYSDEPR